jgi:hypothetical protein
MNKIYQPIVKEKAKKFIDTLISVDFFKEYGIKDTQFATTYVCDKLTDKFIEGTIDGDMLEIFNQDELDSLFKNIITESLLRELMEKNLVDSIIDENGDERFFVKKDNFNSNLNQI